MERYKLGYWLYQDLKFLTCIYHQNLQRQSGALKVVAINYCNIKDETMEHIVTLLLVNIAEYSQDSNLLKINGLFVKMLQLHLGSLYAFMSLLSLIISR